jgi:hypothetical protein
VSWATAGVIFRTGFLPRWFGWASVVAGVFCLGAVLFVPVFVYWLWIVIVSILLARTAEVAEAPAG